MTLVDGEWDGGDREAADQCTMFGNNLVVRQTVEGQRKISTLLEALRSENAAHSVKVEATWVWLDDQKREALRTMTNSGSHSSPPASLDAKRLWELVRDSVACRGQITSLNGQLVHFSTGQRRVISTGAQPTVGVGAAAYMPRTEVVNIGATLQVTATVSRRRRSVLLDLHSVVTQWGTQGDPLKVTSQSFSSSSEKSGGGVLVQDMTTVDRANVETQEWSTTAAIPLGTPVLIGAVTFNDPAATTINPGKPQQPELGLIVEVHDNN